MLSRQRNRFEATVKNPRTKAGRTRTWKVGSGCRLPVTNPARARRAWKVCEAVHFLWVLCRRQVCSFSSDILLIRVIADSQILCWFTSGSTSVHRRPSFLASFNSDVRRISFISNSDNPKVHNSFDGKICSYALVSYAKRFRGSRPRFSNTFSNNLFGKLE